MPVGPRALWTATARARTLRRMNAGFERIELTTTDTVGSLRLARPDRGNALDHRTLEELIAAAAWFDARSDVRVVIVASSGRSFCSGFDLDGPGPVSGDGGLAASVDLGRLAMNAITSMRAVTVARVTVAPVVVVSSLRLRVICVSLRRMPSSRCRNPISAYPSRGPRCRDSSGRSDRREPRISFSAPVRSAGPMPPPTDSSRQRCPSRSSTPGGARWSKGSAHAAPRCHVRVGRDRSPRRMHRRDRRRHHRHRQHDARLCG